MQRAPMRLEKSPPSQITSFELVSLSAITQSLGLLPLKIIPLLAIIVFA